MWRCGLRIAEALALARADIDLEGDVLGLNRRGRPLFSTLKGGEVDQSYVRHLLIRLAAKVISTTRTLTRCGIATPPDSRARARR
jgi:integrase